MSIFGVKRVSEEKFCPRTVDYRVSNPDIGFPDKLQNTLQPYTHETGESCKDFGVEFIDRE